MTHRLSDRLTGVKYRATSVAKKSTHKGFAHKLPSNGLPQWRISNKTMTHSNMFQSHINFKCKIAPTKYLARQVKMAECFAVASYFCTQTNDISVTIVTVDCDYSTNATESSHSHSLTQLTQPTQFTYLSECKAT